MRDLLRSRKLLLNGGRTLRVDCQDNKTKVSREGIITSDKRDDWEQNRRKEQKSRYRTKPGRCANGTPGITRL
ncbi:hypothetical protein COCSADRAFT_284891 [Bipolaris sorokiniana ND90Pr]|uniref:Uncharacterized protein n=1 Tax=Cochliobolus sativus (strain ND90Pr / ATCC 201652) TaxID=665912 RepID=M2SIU9_COCSN|nr:uncharacterized protein COCSADRAFT_284891 [Bipolaris sorokiniana ND90Pr]EMD67108.1 hypothetical protein COCSADRAFT_284891 [Bipolaris sorokiniana ND90Pr]